ncbi:Calx-beta domain-containing protein [Deltaproteobacteria bacterium TL4]
MINADMGEISGFSISSISGNTTEATGTATFTVKLTSEPTANVVIEVVTSDTTEGTVSPSSLTFTPTNWNANKTVTVTGVNDDVADGNQNYMVQLTINSGNTMDTSGYASMNPDDVSLTNTDNDSPGFIISAISGNTTEAIETATFTVKPSEPTGNVVIDIVMSDTTEGVVGPSSITISTSNWNTEQTVIVTGVDDDITDGNISYGIQLTINSDSNEDTSGYKSLNPEDVSVINTIMIFCPPTPLLV